MGRGSALVGLLLWIAPAPGDRVVVRVPLDGSGRLDAAELLGEPGGAKVPLRGLPGLVGRSLLSQLLGPGVAIEVRADEAVVTIDPSLMQHPDRPGLKARMKDFRKQTRFVPDPPESYGFHANSSYRPDDPARPTVCLIHGINSTGDSFRHLAAALERAGYGVVLYEYPYDQDLDRTADEFARDWRQFREDKGDHRAWSILTHSMGSVVGRSYVEGDAFGGDVDHLILIGPTNHGAAVARIQPILNLMHGLTEPGDKPLAAIAGDQGVLGVAAEDLTPGSDFLESLNRRPRRAGVSYHILAGNSGFLTRAKRAQVDARLRDARRSGGLMGSLSRFALSDAGPALDEITEGTGDGCVSVASTRLDGVGDHEIIAVNHVELIRGPLLYPDPGPIACLPFVLGRLPDPEPGARSGRLRGTTRTEPPRHR